MVLSTCFLIFILWFCCFTAFKERNFRLSSRSLSKSIKETQSNLNELGLNKNSQFALSQSSKTDQQSNFEKSSLFVKDDSSESYVLDMLPTSLNKAKSNNNNNNDNDNNNNDCNIIRSKANSNLKQSDQTKPRKLKIRNEENEYANKPRSTTSNTNDPKAQSPTTNTFLTENSIKKNSPRNDSAAVTPQSHQYEKISDKEKDKESKPSTLKKKKKKSPSSFTNKINVERVNRGFTNDDENYYNDQEYFNYDMNYENFEIPIERSIQQAHGDARKKQINGVDNSDYYKVSQINVVTRNEKPSISVLSSNKNANSARSNRKSSFDDKLMQSTTSSRQQYEIRSSSSGIGAGNYITDTNKHFNSPKSNSLNRKLETDKEINDGFSTNYSSRAFSLRGQPRLSREEIEREFHLYRQEYKRRLKDLFLDSQSSSNTPQSSIDGVNRNTHVYHNSRQREPSPKHVAFYPQNNSSMARSKAVDIPILYAPLEGKILPIYHQKSSNSKPAITKIKSKKVEECEQIWQI
jgi:hypothetical protein